MRHKLYLWKELLKYELEGSNFKAVILMSVCINLIFANITMLQDNFFAQVIAPFSDYSYVIAILLLLCFNTFYTDRAFEQNTSMIIRLKNKKEMLRKLVFQIIISNTLVLLINQVISVTILNFTCHLPLDFGFYRHYNITNLQYVFFYLLRSYVLIELMLLFVFFIWKLSGHIGAISALIIYIFSIAFSPVIEGERLGNFYNMKFHPTQYFYQNYYPNFSSELVFSFIYIAGIIIIVVALYEITSVYMKKIGE